MAYQTLSQRLDELERTDPAVKAAADRYDFVVWRMNRKAERRRKLLGAQESEGQ